MAATTALIYPLGAVAPAVSLGVVYLLAVLVISTLQGSLHADAATPGWLALRLRLIAANRTMPLQLDPCL